MRDSVSIFLIGGLVALAMNVTGCAVDHAGRSSGGGVPPKAAPFHPKPDRRPDSINDKPSVAQVSYQQPVSTAVVASQAELTLESLQHLALANHPALSQATAAANRSMGIRQQVGLRPNPVIGYFAEEVGNEDSAGLQGAFISQTFVRAGKLEANRHVLAHDVNAMRWQVETRRVRVLTDVEAHFYRVLAAQRRLEMARDFREVAAKGLAIAKDRLEAGGTRPDVLQAEIQLTEVDLLIQRAEIDVDAAWNQLAAFVGVPDMVQTTLIGELPALPAEQSLDSVYERIVSESPLLKAAVERVCRARANLRRQEVQAIPNISGQVGLGHDYASGDQFANVQVSVPFPYHNTNQGNILAAQAAVAEATQDVERIKLQIRSELAGTIREYELAAATVRQYETTILPKAKESERLIAETYAAGEVDFLRVLTARKMYFDANLQYVATLGELAAANARIEGLLLSGGLSSVESYDGEDSLRDQALSGQ